MFEENYYFDPKQSSTYKDKDYRATIYFGSGKLEGHFGTDDLIIGENEETSIHIKNQTMGLMTTIDFLDNSYDAIIGLAYPAMSDAGLPIFDMMMQQKLLH
jgi:hypothetical protein